MNSRMFRFPTRRDATQAGRPRTPQARKVPLGYPAARCGTTGPGQRTRQEVLRSLLVTLASIVIRAGNTELIVPWATRRRSTKSLATPPVRSPPMPATYTSPVTPDLVTFLRSHFVLDWHGIHGANHWARVKLNGLLLAAETGADAHVVELFAFLHYCRRRRARVARLRRDPAELPRLDRLRARVPARKRQGPRRRRPRGHGACREDPGRDRVHGSEAHRHRRRQLRRLHDADGARQEARRVRGRREPVRHHQRVHDAGAGRHRRAARLPARAWSAIRSGTATRTCASRR